MIMIESIFDALRACWTPRTVGWGVRLARQVVTVEAGSELVEGRHVASVSYHGGMATIYPRKIGASTGASLWKIDDRGLRRSCAGEIRRVGGKGGSRLVLVCQPFSLAVLPDLLRPSGDAERTGESVLGDISGATGISVTELSRWALDRRSDARSQFWSVITDQLIDRGLITAPVGGFSRGVTS